MRAEGAWTQRGAPAVLARAGEYVSAGSVDMAGVTTVDSAALALMLELTRRARAQGQSLHFTNLPPALATLVGFFEIDSILSVT